jgi:hypothetical protein
VLVPAGTETDRFRSAVVTTADAGLPLQLIAAGGSIGIALALYPLLDVRGPANLAAVMASSVGASMYCYLLYHPQLVPRWLSGWGTGDRLGLWLIARGFTSPGHLTTPLLDRTDSKK